MKLLILNQYALPRGAPGITRHGDLGAILAARNHAVHVIASRFNYLTRTTRKSTKATRAEMHSGVRFTWLDTGSYARNDRSRIQSFAAYVLLAAVVGFRRTNKPDLVIASTPHLFTGIAGAVIAIRHRVPFILEVRDLWPSVLVDLGAVRRGSVTHRLLEELERWLYRRARLVIFVPPSGRRRLREVGVTTKSVHVPNGADLNGPKEPIPPSLAAVLAELRGKSVVMYAGAHGVANDLGVLISALDELRDSAPETYERIALIFIGDGSEKKALADRILASGHACVRLHPPIRKPAVVQALRAADALIVNVAPAIAHSYGLSPNKLFDYMAAARPVLISSYGPTVVDDARAGLRYEPGDASALADRMVKLVSASADERRTMGLRGREMVERRYSLSAAADQLEEALLGVLHT